MENQNIILVGGVGLVKGRIRDAGKIMVEIGTRLEPLLRQTGYIEKAPFRTVSLILRYGERKNLVPEYGPINKRHSELPVAVELEMSKLRFATRQEVELAFQEAMVETLIHVAKKYGLPHEALNELIENDTNLRWNH